MSAKTVMITGGSGFIGQLLQRGLRARGYRIDVFDRLRGPIVNVLRRTHLGPGTSARAIARARRLRLGQARLEHALIRVGVLGPSWDDILDLRSRLVERFRKSHAVVHLAALPHPNVPGAAEADYRRINYDGAVNVFEAVRAAAVPKFVFASSAQVYGINKPVRIDQFPILESNYLPTLSEGQSIYGALKAEFEGYLAAGCRTGHTQAVALRLECPGVRSNVPWNFYISTSIENTVTAFACALEAELPTGFAVCNVADEHVDPAIVDVQAFLETHWSDVPNHTRGNESLLSIETARRLLGYAPTRSGTYYPLPLIWG